MSEEISFHQWSDIVLSLEFTVQHPEEFLMSRDDKNLLKAVNSLYIGAMIICARIVDFNDWGIEGDIE